MTSATPQTAHANDGYHHGDLPNALRKAAAEVIAERGVGAFSLREVARRAGVSHTAPAHHFGDVRGLLTALAGEGFDLLADATSAAVAQHTDPAERLVAVGQAYIEVARAHPAHFQVMFRTDIVSPEDTQLAACGLRAYSVLEDAVRDLIESEGLDVEVDTAAWMCWSATQGLVLLEPKIALLNELKGGAPFSTAELIRRYVLVILDGLRHAGGAVTS